MKKIGFTLMLAILTFVTSYAQTKVVSLSEKNQVVDGNLICQKENLALKLQASSTLQSQGSNSYNVNNLRNGNLSNAWVEGVSGYGVGEWIEYTFPAGKKISGISIANGYVKSLSAWKSNSRVKKLKVSFNNIEIAMLNLEDSRSIQAFSFYEGIGLDSREWTLKFEIVEVYKGDKYDDVAISAISFESPLQSISGLQWNFQAIDLGLSVKWANCNIGATSQEQVGKYFCWKSAKQLEKNGWRLPTENECKELLNSCKKTWTTINGISGYTFTAPNGNSIFLPATGDSAGYASESGEGENKNITGNYWSGSAEIDKEEYDEGNEIHTSIYGINLKFDKSNASVEVCGDSEDCSLNWYSIRLVRK